MNTLHQNCELITQDNETYIRLPSGTWYWLCSYLFERAKLATKSVTLEYVYQKDFYKQTGELK